MNQPTLNQTLSTALKLPTVLPNHTAVLRFNNRHVIDFASPLAEQWFGDIVLNKTQLNDQWLSASGIHLSDRRFRTLQLSNLLNNDLSEPYLGLSMANKTVWVKWQLHKGETNLLWLTDVTELMNEMHSLHNRAEEADTRDFATRLYNRRYAIERLEQIHHHAKRYHTPFTIALIDIDHFKRVNDTFGNAYGDEVLARLAKVIRNSFRETDLCARFGGEEFLVIMPETATQDAMYSLDRLRQQVSELKWSKMQRPITISSGVVSWQVNKSIEQLIFLADQRLITAKQAGRNQVCGDLT